MRTSRAWACALVLGLLPAAPAFGQADPVGEHLKHLEKQLKHRREHKRLDAIERLRRLGPRAKRLLPVVVSILNKDPDTNARILAARAAASIDPTDIKVYTSLSNTLKDLKHHYQLRTEAARALGYMARKSELLRPRIIDDLSVELRSQKHGNLADVAMAEALGELGEEAYDSGPSLEYALRKTPFKEVRVAAFVAMARVSHKSSNLKVSRVVFRLKDRSLARRARAFGNLRVMGPEAKSAVRPLLGVVTGGGPVYERVVALEALAAIAPTDDAVIEQFVAAASSDDYLLQPTGRRCLAAISRARGNEAVSALLKHLDSKNDEVRITIAETLHRIAPRHPNVVAAMVVHVRRANAGDPELFLHAVFDSIRAAQARHAVTPLLELLDRKSPVYRGRNDTTTAYLIGHVLVVLSELGVPKRGAARVIAELRREHPYTLPAACRAVGALGARGAVAVDQLIRVVEKRPWTPMLPFLPDAFPTVEAIRALGRIGPAAKPAIPTLTRLSNRKTAGMSQVAVLETQAARKALELIRG